MTALEKLEAWCWSQIEDLGSGIYPDEDIYDYQLMLAKIAELEKEKEG